MQRKQPGDRERDKGGILHRHPVHHPDRIRVAPPAPPRFPPAGVSGEQRSRHRDAGPQGLRVGHRATTLIA